jgi:pimeloyl-ACP methyl ester carboxylesterase
MSTFVLVHGAWQGASTWDLIVPKLQAEGHKVFTPVLTGLGEDSHRLSPAVNLDSHIDDVAGFLERENLHGVTLVGNSYAGMVITGIAEKESGRLSRLIYVDAFVPDDGESALDLLPVTVQMHFERRLVQVAKGGDCSPVRVFWMRGAYNPASNASMCIRDCATSVSDASSRKFVCRRMHPKSSKKRS